MKANQTTSKDVDEYIARFPDDVQAILEKVRATIRQAAPEAKEVISYQMPAFHLKGNLVYFAAWKEHIGFYPPISGDEELRKQSRFMREPRVTCNSHSINRFPMSLIGRIVQHRVKAKLGTRSGKRQKAIALCISD